jgi:hypothetical protein
VETLEKLGQAIKTPEGFEKYFKEVLTAMPSDDDFSNHQSGVTFGNDDGYYWDRTSVELEDDNTLTVTFDVGSGSGWIDCEFTEYKVTFEQFRQYLLNRKWEDPDVNTVQLLAFVISDIDGAIEDVDEDEHTYGNHAED